MGLRSTTLVLAATSSLLGGLIFGYELGIISGALLMLKTVFQLTCFEQEALVSAVLFGALLASLIGGFIIDRSGRRTSIMGSNLVVLAGSIILIATSSFWWLVVGRVTVGFAISISSMACCIYVSEIVRPHQRGTLVSLYETGITVGILISYAMNYFLSAVNDGWKYMFGLAIIPAAFQFIVILFLPSKPHTLNFWEQDSDNGFIELEEAGESGEFKPDTYDKQYTFLDLFRSKDNMRTRTLLGLGLVLFQQFTGQPNVLYYASTIFRSVGFQSNSSAVLASVGLGVVKVASTLIAICFADKAGRRILLLAGCIVMTIAISGIGIVSFMVELDSHRDCGSIRSKNTSYGDSNASQLLGIIHAGTPTINTKDNLAHQLAMVIQSPSLSNSAGSKHTASMFPNSTVPPAGPDSNYAILNWITLLSMMAFVSAFSIGFGPMTWLVLSEIYPADIRGRAFAFCNSFNWAANLLITLTFLEVIGSIGLGWTFLLYGGVGLLAIAFIYFFIPETKGQSLEEIDQQLSSKRISKRRETSKGVRKRPSTGPPYQRVGKSNWT
ncbi:solute carrier family 2, facilitated glucose transporter member 10 [Xenopus laevis]|uniref:Solute carrier family 2, facilitated glucose transporter member 10 n=1 Tax=Xenopus laevis TaxID=8355 RepID=GTR10_XENLA|nr:solute carrier family 2, facilitated glucose transporter member 10 [Xenopus laevis]Q6GN01.1 RecName: Full=Solute carrier family 2, facilitated glucose transporter member 10; AltName: Full=Glucose transporter type 10; Short=GLUT-10 [Xenopus laevis]AAH73721.1 MGC83667 protein [Xenopus laevis]